MIPESNDGEIVIINPHIEAKSGDFVVIKNDDKGEATFKQLKKYGDTFVLHPLNPKYPDIELKKRTKSGLSGRL